MKNDSDNTAGYGCIIAVSLIFLIPLIIELIQTLIPLAILAGIGYCVFKLLMYDQRTGNVTEYFERTFNVGKNKSNNIIELPQGNDQVYGLPQPTEDILQKLEELKDKIEMLELENRNLRSKQKKAIKKKLKAHVEKMEKKSKHAFLGHVFDEPSTSYQKSDEYERIEYEEKKKKKEQQFEIRELKQEMKEQLFEQEKETMKVSFEAKEDRTNIRMEMKDRFIRTDEMIMKLENKVITIKGYFEEKIAQMNVNFQKEISTVKDHISNLRVDVERGFANVKGELADMKISFGKEILRIDKAQMRIVQKLGEFENKVRKFAIETQRIKNEAERFQIRGQRVLEQAQILYQKHRNEIKVMGKDIEVGLEKMALHKSDFALKAGKAKLQLDKISQDQYLELKNIGYAEMGVKMLRQDFTQRENNMMLKMNNLIAEKKRVEERIRERESRNLETASLQHRINMLDQKYQHASHTNSIMKREFNVFKKLSKG